jgi:hypothetical protein
MKSKEQQLDDPATVELYRDLDELIYWEADDPRVAAVGDRFVAALEAADVEGAVYDEEMPDELAEFLDAVFLDSVPIARRLMDRLEERGRRGCTKFERIQPTW